MRYSLSVSYLCTAHYSRTQPVIGRHSHGNPLIDVTEQESQNQRWGKPASVLPSLCSIHSSSQLIVISTTVQSGRLPDASSTVSGQMAAGNRVATAASLSFRQQLLTVKNSRHKVDALKCGEFLFLHLTVCLADSDMHF